MLTKYGEVLLKLKQKHGITQKKIAEKLFVASGTVSAFANGVRTIPNEFTDELIKAFDLSDEIIAELREAEFGLLRSNKRGLVFNTLGFDKNRSTCLQLFYERLPKLSDEKVAKLIKDLGGTL